MYLYNFFFHMCYKKRLFFFFESHIFQSSRLKSRLLPCKFYFELISIYKTDSAFTKIL